MHRYKVKQIFKDGQERHILVDEHGAHYYREPSLEYGEYHTFEHFERVTFATPDEAWAAIADVPHIHLDTPLYRYTFYIKGETPFSYISLQERPTADGDWIALQSTDGENVSVAASQVVRLVVVKV